MGVHRVRHVMPIAVALLVVLGILLSPGFIGTRPPHGAPNPLRTDFSASLMIESNGTVSVPGVFAVNANTYTLLRNYSGSMEDLRDGSILLGAGYVLNHTNGSA